MRLFLLTFFTMLAFASNSLLTRWAVEPGHIDAISFALIRVLAGAVFLVLLTLRGGSHLRWRGAARVVGAVSLATYMLGFSLAYVTLDAGLGALILFGVVQITMFTYSTLTGMQPTARQLFGAAVAFGGLMLALWPAPNATADTAGALLMILAGIGWAAYTLSGRGAQTPLTDTAANFVLCFPLLFVLTIAFAEHLSFFGIVLAVLCGAVTSGLGYALWYSVLPQLQQNLAAIVQLSVPVLAIIGGNLLLQEPVTLTVIFAAALVISGIALAITKRSFPERHS